LKKKIELGLHLPDIKQFAPWLTEGQAVTVILGANGAANLSEKWITTTFAIVRNMVATLLRI
jgi:hypothetical protein